ncbi:unnamed protein product [Paramecium sonneborni]|uniref:Uncharacterized protein n=1 Tax=Paramecium sonneborni TaxID=65129 RepID=A0A8S1PEW3_9CILI|nr:unnamed protein product [Paramecium sonneborni]
MKKNFQKQTTVLNIQSHRSERSNSSNIFQEPHCNSIKISKKNIRCDKYSTQETLISEAISSQLNQTQIKLKKIDQLKNQLQKLKQNLENQSKQKLNLCNIIDDTIQNLIQLKDLFQIKKLEEPWQEIIQMEQDIYLNEENIIKSIQISHFNQIIIQHQLGILQLDSQLQKIQQQNFWVTQIQTLHETFIQKNHVILQLLKPKTLNNLQQSIKNNGGNFGHSFGQKY